MFQPIVVRADFIKIDAETLQADDRSEAALDELHAFARSARVVMKRVEAFPAAA